MLSEIKIAVIGLGYVGLPLAIEFAKKYNVVGFDIVEIAPKEGEILTQFNCAKLLYKFISYLSFYNKI